MTSSLTKKEAAFGNLQDYLNMPRTLGQIQAAIRNDVSASTIARIALSSVQRTPKLLECTPQSVIASILTATAMGLECDGTQAYLVPFKDKRANVTICTLIPGYRGLVQLAYQSDKVKSVETRNVYARDDFDLDYGAEQQIKHRPYRKADRGEIIAVYMTARLANGGVIQENMWRDEVDAIRDRSKAGRDGPWVTDYPAMSRKTVCKRGLKWVPSSPALQRAIAIDDENEAGLNQSLDFLDIEAQPSRPAPQSPKDRMVANAKAKAPTVDPEGAQCAGMDAVKPQLATPTVAAIPEQQAETDVPNEAIAETSAPVQPKAGDALDATRKKIFDINMKLAPSVSKQFLEDAGLTKINEIGDLDGDAIQSILDLAVSLS